MPASFCLTLLRKGDLESDDREGDLDSDDTVLVLVDAADGASLGKNEATEVLADFYKETV